MPYTFPPIINVLELSERQNNENLILIDARSGKTAKSAYREKHLAGALFVDLDTQLAAIKDDASKGGRHPLPSAEHFSKTLASLGITPESHVVIYDDKSGANAAARFWWMLRAVGHERVQVLNGGFQEAEKSGFPMESGDETPIPAEPPYPFEKWQLPTADIHEVEVASKHENSIIIDVRESGRYNGEFEPIDIVAGHIPGAINIPFITNLNSNGLFLPPDELRNKYQPIFNKVKPENVIVHCGSGVTACHTLLAMAHAGFDIPKLYNGSWSEWSRNGKAIGRNV